MGDIQELYIGIKLVGDDTYIADLEAFLKSTKQLDFPTLLALIGRMTSITWVDIKIVPQTINTISEEILHPKGE